MILVNLLFQCHFECRIMIAPKLSVLDMLMSDTINGQKSSIPLLFPTVSDRDVATVVIEARNGLTSSSRRG